ncbi:hypothetical protein BGW36DRAFT_433135 [Talaromyces proteolyticus]|uniref:Transmembrane protein n=1 Tax=Talaromyces proteolyticus TaxID=1131652 RepID=A0AAD4KEP4_9EURO|nr:uncharacterized protein BGW36DRAFT_433135 [Talaromyces proteolyticus]KAH8690183.1 hypothetical protein BGW36DRAFT_433135 [Talaromyces proteolyticus]
MPLFRLNPFKSLNNHLTTTTKPSIICENCLHKQPQNTTNDVVVASLVVLCSYFLAFLDDLEIQLATIRSVERGVIVCLLGGTVFLSFLGVSFWVGVVLLPWLIGAWILWTYVSRGFEKTVSALDD